MCGDSDAAGEVMRAASSVNALAESGLLPLAQAEWAPELQLDASLNGCLGRTAGQRNKGGNQSGPQHHGNAQGSR